MGILDVLIVVGAAFAGVLAFEAWRNFRPVRGNQRLLRWLPRI